MTNIYVHEDLHEMNLYPCAYSMTFNVTKKPGHDKLTLNAILNQRSNDVLAANNWNVCQYAVLIHMLAQVCDRRCTYLRQTCADDRGTDQPQAASGTEVLAESGGQRLLSVYKR